MHQNQNPSFMCNVFCICRNCICTNINFIFQNLQTLHSLNMHVSCQCLIEIEIHASRAMHSAHATIEFQPVNLMMITSRHLQKKKKVEKKIVRFRNYCRSSLIGSRDTWVQGAIRVLRASSLHEKSFALTTLHIPT